MIGVLPGPAQPVHRARAPHRAATGNPSGRRERQPACCPAVACRAGPAGLQQMHRSRGRRPASEGRNSRKEPWQPPEPMGTTGPGTTTKVQVPGAYHLQEKRPVWAGSRTPGIPGGQSDCRLLRRGERSVFGIGRHCPLANGCGLSRLVASADRAVEKYQCREHRNSDTPTAETWDAEITRMPSLVRWTSSACLVLQQPAKSFSSES